MVVQMVVLINCDKKNVLGSEEHLLQIQSERALSSE